MRIRSCEILRKFVFRSSRFLASYSLKPLYHKVKFLSRKFLIATLRELKLSSANEFFICFAAGSCLQNYVLESILEPCLGFAWLIMILGNSWSIAGHQFSLSTNLGSVPPCSKILDSLFSSVSLQMTVVSGALSSHCSLPLVSWPFPLSRGFGEGRAQMSFVPRVSVFDAV